MKLFSLVLLLLLGCTSSTKSKPNNVHVTQGDHYWNTNSNDSKRDSNCVYIMKSNGYVFVCGYYTYERTD